jgi:hypothetical protein
MRPQEMEPERDTNHLNLQLKQVPVTALAGLKAFLDYNISLNLVADRYPEGVEQQH